jgi:hypothetical protein
MGAAKKIAETALFPYDRWASLQELAREYRGAAPFPHAVFDEFLDPALARRVLSEFPKPGDTIWTQYKHVNSNKLGKSDSSQFPPTIRALVEELLSQRFLDWLTALTGIEGLIADPGLDGGGLHQIETGGHLNIHADFSSHYRKPELSRRLNLLIYLNDGWQDEWNGQLELWDRKMVRCEKKVSPQLNRAVIFSTDADSYHGHPDKLVCPTGTTRKSIALYYYTLEAAGRVRHDATHYVARPDDSLIRKLLIRVDHQLIRIYSFLRRRVGFSDRWISGLIARLSGKKPKK